MRAWVRIWRRIWRCGGAGLASDSGAGSAWRTGKEHVEAGSLTQRQSGLGDLVDGVALDQAVAVDAVDGAAAGVEQAQVVVDLGGGGDGGARDCGWCSSA